MGYLREAVVPALRRPPARADFCVRVDSPLGRYWTSLLHPLTAAGGSVAVLGRLPRRDYDNPDAPGAGPVRLAGVRFGVWPPRATAATTLLAESSRRRLDARPWRKRLRLSLAVDDDCAGAEPFYRLPYGVHAGFISRGWDALFAQQRPAARSTRILFAGNTDPRLYDGGLWRSRKARHGIALTRFEAVEALAERLSPASMLVADWEGDDLARLFDGSCRDRVLMVRWNAYRGPQWPRALGAAEFFLALPGVQMPMCHNVIEALASGCVPITNYADWFLPRLVDGQECLAFTDAASLIAAVERALAMPPDELQRLRAGAVAYYERHLAPARVPEALDALPDGATVYLLTEHPEPLAKVRRGSIAFPAGA